MFYFDVWLFFLLFKAGNSALWVAQFGASSIEKEAGSPLPPPPPPSEFVTALNGEFFFSFLRNPLECDL